MSRSTPLRKLRLTATILTLAALLPGLPAAVRAQQSTTGPVPPPGTDRGLRAPDRADVVIPGVPAYIWHHGCGPTALGMMIGYWDGLGFPDLVAGSAATQTTAVNAMIADDGGQPNCGLPDGDHYQDYACPLNNDPDRSELGGAHESNCVGDFMRTSWSLVNNNYGWSWLGDVAPAFLQYVALISSEYVAQAQTLGWMTWAQYMAEIDEGRPLVLLVDTDGSGGTDHFVTAIGYDDVTQEYGVRDTWDSGVHWYAWRQMAPGVPWGIYALVTFEVSNPAFACCIGEICQVLDEDQCQAAGGIWHGGELLCDPNPCADFACCVGDTCVVLSYADCSRAGGEWLSGLEECDPFPCSDFACCIQEHCMLMNLGECLTAGGEWRAGITTCDDELCLPSTVKLSGGVLLAHAPAGITYTSGADWCAYYADSVAVTHSYQQVPRIDPPGPETPAVWYVLAGWPESKEWCTTTFGLGEYDPLAFLIFEADPCHGGGVEAHTAAWPGPHEGTQVVHAVKWQGNYEPVYAFVSYAYGAGRIPLEAFSYAGSAGFTNCRGTDYPIDCYGALGVYQDGVECHPAGERFACCLAEGCSLLDESACLSGGGTWQPGTVSCDPDPCSGQGIAAPAGGSPGWLSCAPNPFASALEVNYRTGGRAEAAELAVYDITGRCVRLLSRGSSPGSGQRVVWDGRDDRGARAPSGIYFVRLTLPGGPLGQRVLLLRGVVE